MISLEKFKSLIDDKNISDKEAEEARLVCYQWAKFIFEFWRKDKLLKEKHTPFH